MFLAYAIGYSFIKFMKQDAFFGKIDKFLKLNFSVTLLSLNIIDAGL